MAKSTKCAVPSCRLDGHGSCTWKTRRIVEGAEELTGKTCAMSLCSVHATVAGKGLLCPWHMMKAKEGGWL